MYKLIESQQMITPTGLAQTNHLHGNFTCGEHVLWSRDKWIIFQENKVILFPFLINEKIKVAALNF